MKPTLLVALLFVGLSLFGAPYLSAPDPALVLSQADLRIERRADQGYHLFVRAKPGIGSILLTESTRDPTLKTDSYAFRSLEPNAVNAGEQRLLDGKAIKITPNTLFLVDSTPEPDPDFGRAFHIFIPSVVAWGYSWARSGTVVVHDGTFVNIRAFSKRFADYSGTFADNPYLIRVTRAVDLGAPTAPAVPAAAPAPAPGAPAGAPAAPPPRAPAVDTATPPLLVQATPAPSPGSGAPPPRPAAAVPKPAPQMAANTAPANTAPANTAPANTAPANTAPANTAPATPVSAAAASAPRTTALAISSAARNLYYPETLVSYAAVASASGGELRYAGADGDVAHQIDSLVAREEGKALDLVLCLDTTTSMANGVNDLRDELPALLAKRIPRLASFRVGVLAFKDYFEEYLYKRFDFVGSASALSSELSNVEARGGRDVPQAVYEALYASVSEYPWAAAKRLVVLVGDSPPHPEPVGTIGEDEVKAASADEGVEISAVAVPH